MKFLTHQAKLVCKHELGKIQLEPSQDWVRIEGAAVLIDPDPEKRGIKGCPNIGATIKPCKKTFRVQRGYSDLVRIGGQRVCLDIVTGLTDGTPPGLVEYIVRDAGQMLVSERP